MAKIADIAVRCHAQHDDVRLHLRSVLGGIRRAFGAVDQDEAREPPTENPQRLHHSDVSEQSQYQQHSRAETQRPDRSNASNPLPAQELPPLKAQPPNNDGTEHQHQAVGSPPLIVQRPAHDNAQPKAPLRVAPPTPTYVFVGVQGQAQEPPPASASSLHHNNSDEQRRPQEVSSAEAQLPDHASTSNPGQTQGPSPGTGNRSNQIDTVEQPQALRPSLLKGKRPNLIIVEDQIQA
jgi:hypothetical protein